MKAFLMKWSVLVLTLSLFSSCGGGGAPFAPPQSGGGEGSTGSPVNLGVANTTLTRAASIGALGSSYYKFTAGSSSGAYTISLSSTHSDLSWDLYSSSNYWIASCDANITAVDETCTTPALTAGLVYYLNVDEWDMVAGSFTLSVSPPVNPTTPTANAGPDRNVKTGTKVTLNGSGSSDPNGDPLTYAWSFTQRPIGSAATLSSTVVTQPTFTADVNGTYIVRLVVNDGTADSLPDSVNITASTFNSTPTASAGVNQHIVAGASSVVTLDGSASSDADGDPLTYAWTMTAKPGGSTAALSNTTVVAPTFTADIEGTYTLGLVVNDGTVNSVPAIVTIKAYRKMRTTRRKPA